MVNPKSIRALRAVNGLRSLGWTYMGERWWSLWDGYEDEITSIYQPLGAVRYRLWSRGATSERWYDTFTEAAEHVIEVERGVES